MSCLALASCASYAWPQALVGPEFQVASHTRTLTSGAAVAAAADGRFVVVWEDQIRDGSASGIFARRFDAAGHADGPEFRVNTQARNYQLRPAVAADAGGGFVVVWASYRQDGSDYGVFGQRYDAAGARAGAEFRVNSATAGTQFAPDVAVDAGGGFVVVWLSGSAARGFDVAGQRYDAAGTPQGPEFVVNAYTTGDQGYPVVAPRPDGGFVVAWHGDGADDGDVFAQRFDSAGARLGPEIRVNTYRASTQRYPAIAADPAGNFVIGWQSYGQDGSGWGVFARRFDALGEPQGPELAVNAFTTGEQARPSLSAADDGGFAVAWDAEGQDGSERGVFARLYAADGAPRGTEFRLNEFTPGAQGGSALAAQPGGEFAAVWSSHSATHDVYGPGEGTFGRRFGMPADMIFADGFESGSLRAWSAGSSDGGDLAVSGDAALRATTAGLRALLGHAGGAYVEDHSPTAENRYRARFYFDPNGFDPGEADGHFRTRLFVALGESPGRRLASVVLRRRAGRYALRASVRLDDDTQAETAFIPLSAGAHAVELDWHRASGAGAADGFLHLWLDGVPVSTFDGLANSRSPVDFVRLGALSVKGGASGTLFWDEFESRRETYIGP